MSTPTIKQRLQQIEKYVERLDQKAKNIVFSSKVTGLGSRRIRKVKSIFKQRQNMMRQELKEIQTFLEELWTRIAVLSQKQLEQIITTLQDRLYRLQNDLNSWQKTQLTM